MTTQAAVGDDMRERALRSARDAIASLDEFALGGADIVDTHTGESIGQYGIRDELLSEIDAAIASVPPEPVCDLCVGECRGHSLGHPEEWEPEPGSKAAVPPVPIDDGLREALRLAANRLRAAAINEAPEGTREYYAYSEWADEADAVLAALHPNQLSGSGEKPPEEPLG
jgi:hypothetical protein